MMKRVFRYKEEIIMDKRSDGAKIPNICYDCKWGKKSSFAKMRCTNRYAKVTKEGDAWICFSYSKNKLF